jgi:hypothetical protein
LFHSPTFDTPLVHFTSIGTISFFIFVSLVYTI